MGPSEEATSRSLSQGVQLNIHPKIQSDPNYRPDQIFGAGRAFLPLSNPVTVRVGRRPPQPLRDARRERSQRFSPGLQAARIIAARSKNEALMGRDSPHGMVKNPTQGTAKPWF